MGQMMRQGVTVLLCCGLLMVDGVWRQASGQGRALNPVGRQMLDFGNVFPGVRTATLRTDAVKAGRFDLTGSNRAELRIIFTLPMALTAPAGQTLPLVFAAGDGGVSQSNSIASATAFDPRVPLIIRLSGTGRLFIWLGGTAVPSSTQQAATYTGTITLTAAYTGN